MITGMRYGSYIRVWVKRRITRIPHGRLRKASSIGPQKLRKVSPCPILHHYTLRTSDRKSRWNPTVEAAHTTYGQSTLQPLAALMLTCAYPQSSTPPQTLHSTSQTNCNTSKACTQWMVCH